LLAKKESLAARDGLASGFWRISLGACGLSKSSGDSLVDRTCVSLEFSLWRTWLRDAGPSDLLNKNAAEMEKGSMALWWDLFF